MGWALLLLAFTLLLIRRGWRRAIPKNPVFTLLILALSVRLLPGIVLVQNSNYDIASYSLVSDHVLAGEDVYTREDTASRHPYLPFIMYWMAFAKYLSNSFQLSFNALVKLLPITADALISLILYFYLLKRISPDQAFAGATIYAINPIPVMVSSYHGQFDALPASLMLISIWQIDRSVFSSAWWLGLGVLAKSWPILALPSLLNEIKSYRKRIGYLIFLSIAPILGIFLYIRIFHSDFKTVILKSLSYNHGLGAYGYTYFSHLLLDLWPAWGVSIFTFIYTYGRYFTVLILVIIWFTTARKEKLAAGVLTVLVCFFAVTHAFAVQYLMWLVPLAIINQEYRWLRLFTLSGFAYMFLVYNTVILKLSITTLLPYQTADLALIIPASLPIWFVSIAWIINRVKNTQRIGQVQVNFSSPA